MDIRDAREKVERFISIMVNAVQTSGAYGRNHKLTKDAVGRLYSVATDILSERSEFTIGIIGKEVAFDKKPFYETSKKIAKFISHLSDVKVGKLSFLKGLGKEELDIFIDALAAEIKSHEKHGRIEKALKALEISNILIGIIGEKGEIEEPLSGESEGSGGAADSIQRGAGFNEGIDFLKRSLDDMGNGNPIDERAARLVIGKIVGSLLKNKSSLLILTSLKKHDEYSFVHSMNVAIFTLVQAEALGIPEDLLSDIGVAALMHDIGKLHLEAALVKKYGGLNNRELEKVELHPIDGAEILLEMPGMPLVAAISAFEHHLKYDTQGYPARLYGDKLNLASMMISIADAYDAMRGGHSSYRQTSTEKIYDAMMELSGENFNPDLLELFFNKIGIYPPGTLVEMDDKSIGLVVKENTSDIRRPRVEILYDGKGEEVEEPYTVDLSEKNGAGGHGRTIVRSLDVSEKHRIPGKYRA